MLRVRRKRVNVISAVIVAATAVFSIMTAMYFRLSPVMERLALYAATDSVSHAVNSVIAGELRSGELDCSDIVRLEKDSDGNIAAIVTDMTKVNSLQTKLMGDSLDSVAELADTELGIPIGSLVGGFFFSGRGPKIPIEIVSASNSSARFENRFSDAGINQTRHQIILIITVSIEIVAPGKHLTTDVESEMVLAETVIVGSVPDTYAKIGET